MLKITFSVMGDVVLARALSRFGESCKDFTPAWSQIHDDFLLIESEQFQSQGTRANPWQPLSPDYAAWKAKYFPSMGILQLTGALLSEMSFSIPTRIEPLRLTMTPSIPYAYYHQKGTQKMPARKVIDLTENDKRGWIKIIQTHLVNKAKEEGLQ